MRCLFYREFSFSTVNDEVDGPGQNGVASGNPCYTPHDCVSSGLSNHLCIFLICAIEEAELDNWPGPLQLQDPLITLFIKYASGTFNCKPQFFLIKILKSALRTQLL